MPAYRRLLSPIEIRGKTLKNRIVSTAHEAAWNDFDGKVSIKYADYFIRKAVGGAGLVMTFGSGNVHEQSGALSGSRSVPLWDKRNDTTLMRMAAQVHDHGALLMTQASHLGHRGSSVDSHRPLTAPSGIPDWTHGEIPHALACSEIDEIVESFVAVAVRFEQLGWDGIEVTSFGGHLIEQFWSPVFNRRRDRYGGSFENRLRFGHEALRAIRDAVSDRFLLGFRMTAAMNTDETGLSSDDMLEIAESMGSIECVDLFNISGGTGATIGAQSALVAPDTFPVACHAPAARAVRKRVGVPVLAAGRILDADTAEQSLAAGDCDLVALTRAIIADPDLPKHIESGDPARARPCIAISEGCIGRVYQGHQMLCSVNPSVFYPELEYAANFSDDYRVTVVGGGPAGLEAARMAALRGATVTLFEESSQTGGQVATARLDPFRPHLGRHIDWLADEAQRLRVKVRTGVLADAAAIVATAPDAVILATGARSTVPWSDASATMRVATDVEILRGEVEFSGLSRVAVIDREGHYRGGAAAALIAEGGVPDVALITSATPALSLLDDSQKPSLMRRLQSKGVTLYDNAFAGVTEGQVEVHERWTGKTTLVAPELVVFTGFRRARDELMAPLRSALPRLPVKMAGDCVAPRRLHDAVAEGARAAAELVPTCVEDEQPQPPIVPRI